jgi:hypothetical protein
VDIKPYTQEEIEEIKSSEETYMSSFNDEGKECYGINDENFGSVITLRLIATIEEQQKEIQKLKGV